MDNSIKPEPSAEAKFNGDFYCIETYSGYRSRTRDPLGKQYLLHPGASNEELGEAVLDALAHSRFITNEKELRDLHNYEKGIERYAQWVATLMQRYGYKTRRKLFVKMKSSGIRMQGDIIEIRPTIHEKLEGWGREKDDGIEDVHIRKDASPEEIGAALRLAFERCE